MKIYLLNNIQENDMRRKSTSMKLICLIAVIMAVTSCIGDLFEQGAPVEEQKCSLD